MLGNVDKWYHISRRNQTTQHIYCRLFYFIYHKLIKNQILLNRLRCADEHLYQPFQNKRLKLQLINILEAPIKCFKNVSWIFVEKKIFLNNILKVYQNRKIRNLIFLRIFRSTVLRIFAFWTVHQYGVMLCAYAVTVSFSYRHLV